MPPATIGNMPSVYEGTGLDLQGLALGLIFSGRSPISHNVMEWVKIRLPQSASMLSATNFYNLEKMENISQDVINP